MKSVITASKIKGIHQRSCCCNRHWNDDGVASCIHHVSVEVWWDPLVIVLLQIFSWFWQWKNFENRLISGKVKTYKNCANFLGHPIFITFRAGDQQRSVHCKSLTSRASVSITKTGKAHTVSRLHFMIGGHSAICYDMQVVIDQAVAWGWTGK